MTRHCGVVRDGEGLAALCRWLEELAGRYPAALPVVAAMRVAQGALQRRESRGGHFRSDYPATDAVALHTRMTARVAVAA